LLYILSLCAILGACSVFGLCIRQLCEPDPPYGGQWHPTSAIQAYTPGLAGREPNAVDNTSPLIAQAKALASLLAPAPAPEGTEVPAAKIVKQEPTGPAAPIRPASASVKFRLHGTSYYPKEPERSMALIWEPGGAEGTHRWVKEGAEIGHFVVNEIRHSLIVLRDGDKLRELAVERRPMLRRLARDGREGARKVSSAVGVDSGPLSTHSGPNGVDASGGH
jgi:hypothetical protein